MRRGSEAAAVVPLPDDGGEDTALAEAPPLSPFPVARWWGSHVREGRWQAEMARLLVDPTYRGEGVPHGNGRPVIGIPGFLAGDASLGLMRRWLKKIGYTAYPSGIAFNVDCSDQALNALEERLVRAHETSGERVALIGHSRGGHFVKALSTRHPDRVACAISMGAGLDEPFAISRPTRAAVAAVRTAHARRDPVGRKACLTTTCDCDFTRDYSAPFPAEVPLTSIYSRGDGVVWWEACVVPYAENVEVEGSHIGLASNRKSFKVVAEALHAAVDR
ncbi:MAG: esterase/lipase family protein [Solirubrobacterales bacterium]